LIFCQGQRSGRFHSVKWFIIVVNSTSFLLLFWVFFFGGGVGLNSELHTC
jgi:hypothetical protein